MDRRTFLAASAAALAGTCRLQRAPAAAAAHPGDPTMIPTLRRARDRGHSRIGWLDSWHTFSFADYHDPAHMGFRSLRVINQDRVTPGAGFPTHPHRDMEIFSYVLEGALQHEDSLGNGRMLRPGEVQLMSAGTGVTHSEFNPSDREGLHFLQIWIQPRQKGLRPSYTEWKPQSSQGDAAKVLVISPDGRDDSARIHQDALVWRLRLPAGQTVEHELAASRGAWLQLISGAVDFAGASLQPGDGAAIERPGRLTVTASQPAEALLFDLG